MTQGLVVRPRSAAFLASRPAATITEGFEVLVQEVIAAITTEPWVRSKVSPPRVTDTVESWSSAPMALRISPRAAAKAVGMSARATRSWGRRGPARLGTMVPMSSSSSAV